MSASPEPKLTKKELLQAVKKLAKSTARDEARRQSLEALKFTSKANQQNYDFNETVARDLVDVKEVLKACESDDPAIDEALDFVRAALEKIDDRQKNIRIADKHGWRTVEILRESRDVAADPTDEKLILSAARQALQEKALEKSTGAVSSVGRPKGANHQPSLYRLQPIACYHPYGLRGARGGRGGIGGNRGAAAVLARKSATTCHDCGLLGHWSGDAECCFTVSTSGGNVASTAHAQGYQHGYGSGLPYGQQLGYGAYGGYGGYGGHGGGQQQQ